MATFGNSTTLILGSLLLHSASKATSLARTRVFSGDVYKRQNSLTLVAFLDFLLDQFANPVHHIVVSKLAGLEIVTFQAKNPDFQAVKLGLVKGLRG